MTKKEIIELLANRLKRPRSEMKRVLESTFHIITDQLSKGQHVQIVGFGKFEIRHRKPRMGRDPQTGLRKQIAETKTAAFKAGKSLKDAVRKKN
ncbi:MAG: HU family DNA-binding protein [Candidatus Margulisbacteria bacterium]|nr:HU family DNA-binding protein [Candidatus Margulisiibacteriota bacterium]